VPSSMGYNPFSNVASNIRVVFSGAVIPPPPSYTKAKPVKNKIRTCKPVEWSNVTIAPGGFNPRKLVVFVISAPGLSRRYTYVANQLHELGMPYERIFTHVSNAHRRVDICKSNDRIFSVIVNKSYVTLPGTPHGMPERMLSLLYNHVEAWNRIARQRHMALVLEDDVNISTSFLPVIRNVMWQLNSHPWDIIWPGYCCCAPDGSPVTPDLALHKSTGCTQSYIINPESAIRMLKSMPIETCHASDHYMNALFTHIPCWRGYATRRNLIIQDKTTFPNSTHRHSHERVVGWRR